MRLMQNGTPGTRNRMAGFYIRMLVAFEITEQYHLQGRPANTFPPSKVYEMPHFLCDASHHPQAVTASLPPHEYHRISSFSYRVMKPVRSVLQKIEELKICRGMGRHLPGRSSR